MKIKGQSGKSYPHPSGCDRWVESDLRDWYDGCLTEAGAYLVKTVGGTMQQSGLPDRWYCHHTLPQRSAWVEHKVAPRTVTSAQRLFLAQLLRRGSHCVSLSLCTDADGGWRLSYGLDLGDRYLLGSEVGLSGVYLATDAGEVGRQLLRDLGRACINLAESYGRWAVKGGEAGPRPS